MINLDLMYFLEENKYRIERIREVEADDGLFVLAAVEYYLEQKEKEHEKELKKTKEQNLKYINEEFDKLDEYIGLWDDSMHNKLLLLEYERKRILEAG